MFQCRHQTKQLTKNGVYQPLLTVEVSPEVHGTKQKRTLRPIAAEQSNGSFSRVTWAVCATSLPLLDKSKFAFHIYSIYESCITYHAQYDTSMHYLFGFPHISPMI